MTKIIVQNSEIWTLKKIQSLVNRETEILKKQIMSIKDKISAFKDRYKTDDRETLYGKVDDMELIEWEGEIETINLPQKKF